MKLEGRLPRPIDERQASGLARDLYGFEATARALPGEYDDNFHLVAPDGSQRVLKVMHPARERSLIDLQCTALEHLAERAPHLTLPRVCHTIHGAAIAGGQVDGVDRLVWMLTYVPGRALAEARPHTAELLGSLGRLLGEKEPGQALPALADELKSFVKERIAPYKAPRWVEFVSALPKTATGKIQRFKLRAGLSSHKVT